jgi:hypothetical protein
MLHKTINFPHGVNAGFLSVKVDVTITTEYAIPLVLLIQEVKDIFSRPVNRHLTEVNMSETYANILWHI